MRAWALLISALLLPGCFAFEEIDKGMEIMEAHTPLASKKKREEEAQADARAATPSQPDPRVAWWKNARSLGPRSKSEADPMVNCRLGSSSRFTRHSDCAARGGVISR